MNPIQPPLPPPPSNGGPSTREIPIPPPSAAATSTQQFPAQQPSAAAAAAAQPQPTGPVDYVPGPPPVPEPAPPAPPAGATAAPRDFLTDVLADEPRRPRDARARARLAATGLAVVALVLLELGLLVHAGAVRLWSTVPLWCGFASAAGLLGLLALAAPGPLGRRLGARGWTVAAGGLAGLAVFWLLVVLPSADTDRGFVLTAALACLGAAVWLAAGRGTAKKGTATGEAA